MTEFYKDGLENIRGMYTYALKDKNNFDSISFADIELHIIKFILSQLGLKSHYLQWEKEFWEKEFKESLKED